jgi:hypothetical protein
MENLMRHFQDWRDVILPGVFDESTREEAMKGRRIINLPMFTAKKDDDGQIPGDGSQEDLDDVLDDDEEIYMYAGFVRPGKHTIIIYDPVNGHFYRKHNIFIRPRDKDTKIQNVDGPVPLKGVEVGVETPPPTEQIIQQMKGPQFKVFQSHLYGDLLHDYNEKIVRMAAKTDLQGVSVSEYCKDAGKNLPRLIKRYDLVLRLWHCTQISQPTVEEQATRVAEILELDPSETVATFQRTVEAMKARYGGKF